MSERDNKEDAQYYVNKLREFWAKKGYNIEARYEPIGCFGHRSLMFKIVTNMVNGLPRDYKPWKSNYHARFK